MKTPTIQEIQERACEVFGITMVTLVSKSKKAIHAKPRQLVMKWCRELGYRVQSVADAFKVLPSTVSHAAHDAVSFTKLELERMEQVKSSFEDRVLICDGDNPVARVWRSMNPISDYETRIECWHGRGNKVA